MMGVLSDRYDIVTAFYFLGAAALACAVALIFMRRWAFASARPQVSPTLP